MKYAMLITDPTFELLDFRSYAKGQLDLVRRSEKEISQNVPYQADPYISIYRDTEIFDMMEPEHQEAILSEFESYNIYGCMFFNFNHLRVLIASIPLDRKITINNDHGTFMNRETFLKFDSWEDFRGPIDWHDH